MITIVIEVKGGLVQAVYTDSQPLKVVVVDYDMGYKQQINHFKLQPINQKIDNILKGIGKNKKK